MIVACIGGPHDGRYMDVPDEGEELEFLDGERYEIVGEEARYIPPK